MEAYAELLDAARKMGGDARKKWEGVADYVLAWSSKKKFDNLRIIQYLPQRMYVTRRTLKQLAVYLVPDSAK